MRLVNFAGFSGLRLALTCLLFTLGGLGLALTFLLLTLGGLLLTLGLGGLGLAEACPDIPLVHFGGLECYSEC